MAGFLKRLFSRGDDTPITADFTNIRKMTAEAKDAAEADMKRAADASRQVVFDALGDMRRCAQSISEARIPADADIPQRVRVTAERSLPGFSESLSRIIPDDKSFSDEPEKFYHEVAGFMQDLAKLQKTKGRFVFAALPDEMKDMKESFGTVGREINNMNAVFSPAIVKRQRADAVNTLLDSYDAVVREYELKKNAASMSEMERGNIARESEELDAEIKKLEASAEYAQFMKLCREKSDLADETAAASDALHLTCVNAGNVFRKVLYAAERDRKKDLLKALTEFSGKFEEAVSSGGAADLKDEWALLYPQVRACADENSGCIKTRSEERLFESADILLRDAENHYSRRAEAQGRLDSVSESVSSSKAGLEHKRLTARKAEVSEIIAAFCRKETVSADVLLESYSAKSAVFVEKLTAALKELYGKEVILENVPELTA